MILRTILLSFAK